MKYLGCIQESSFLRNGEGLEFFGEEPGDNRITKLANANLRKFVKGLDADTLLFCPGVMNQSTGADQLIFVIDSYAEIRTFCTAIGMGESMDVFGNALTPDSKDYDPDSDTLAAQFYLDENDTSTKANGSVIDRYIAWLEENRGSNPDNGEAWAVITTPRELKEALKETKKYDPQWECHYHDYSYDNLVAHLRSIFR